MLEMAHIKASTILSQIPEAEYVLDSPKLVDRIKISAMYSRVMYNQLVYHDYFVFSKIKFCIAKISILHSQFFAYE